MNKVVKIGTIIKQYLKWSFRLTFKRKKEFRNGTIAIKKEKYGITANKLIYIGTNILDLSEILM